MSSKKSSKYHRLTLVFGKSSKCHPKVIQKLSWKDMEAQGRSERSSNIAKGHNFNTIPGPTDQETDRQTDRPTDKVRYRAAQGS